MGSTAPKKYYSLTELLTGAEILEKGSTRDKLLRHGIRLFHKHGVDGTSVGRLLQATGKSKSQFYSHFRDKDDFICEVLDVQMSTMLQFIKRQPLERMADLEKWFAPYLELATLPQNLGCPVGPLATEMSPSHEIVRLKAVEQFDRWLDTVEEALKKLAGNEGFSPAFEPRVAARRLCCSIQGAFLFCRVYQDESFMVELREQFRQELSAFS